MKTKLFLTVMGATFISTLLTCAFIFAPLAVVAFGVPYSAAIKVSVLVSIVVAVFSTLSINN
jgi:hypothetical protein